MHGYHNARTTAPQLTSKHIQWNLNTTSLFVTEVLCITTDFLYPSNSKIYKREPQYNETSVWRTHFASSLALSLYRRSTVSRIETDLRCQNKDGFEFNNHLRII